jgi:hypothetical protein
MEAPFMLAVTLASARRVIQAGMRGRSENAVRHEEEDERRSLSPGFFSISFPLLCKEWQSRMFLPESNKVSKYH